MKADVAAPMASKSASHGSEYKEFHGHIRLELVAMLKHPL